MKITRLDGKKHPYTLLIDRCDLALYRANRWQRHKKGLIRYNGPYKGKGSVLLHRAILNAAPTDFIEFKNGNKLDVRRENICVRDDATWRARKRKPFIRTRTGTHPSGLYFVNSRNVKPSGRSYTYRCAAASFCYQRKEHQCKRRMHLGREIEAICYVLQWRYNMIVQHEIEPNCELVEMLDLARRIARAGGGFEELYGGNAEYEHSVVVGSESSFQVIGFDYAAA